MSTQLPDLSIPLSPAELQARLATRPGIGTGVDTDLVRGRAFPTDQPRFDVAPAFTPPPLWGDPTMGAYLFGV